MQRFFISNPDVVSKILTIQDNRIVHQMNKVLRMKAGSLFSFFDDNGKEMKADVLEINKKFVTANVQEIIERNSESPISVSLYQAIPKKPALFELVVQKATELGVKHIYPLVTERTEKRHINKFERLYSIAVEATEQCGRTSVPIIQHPVDIMNVMPKLSNAYVAYELEKSRNLMEFADEISKNKQADIFIGPEGGFSQKEIDVALKTGAKMFGLGPRILRTETAAIATLSLILAN